MNFLEKLLCGLQYEIEAPSCYGLFHIVWLIATLSTILFLSNRKEKDHDKSLKRILIVYGVGALILELLKQITWSFNYDVSTNIVSWDYEWYAFPFQLCTTPIIVSIICIFLKKGKLRNYLLSYIAYITILGSIATALYPESCFVDMLLVDIHTMYLHLGSLVLSIYLITSKEVGTKFKDLFNGYKVFLVFVFLAELLNILVYKSGILKDETFNMFYISPYFTSALPLFNILQEKLPFILCIITYLLTIFLGGLIVWSIVKLIFKLKDKKKRRN